MQTIKSMYVNTDWLKKNITMSIAMICKIMSSHGYHRPVIYVLFFLYSAGFHWFFKCYQAISNLWEYNLERFLFQNDRHFPWKSWFRNRVEAEFAFWILYCSFHEQ